MRKLEAPTERHRRIAELRGKRYTGAEIAEELGVSRRTVHRYLAEIEEHWGSSREWDEVHDLLPFGLSYRQAAAYNRAAASPEGPTLQNGGVLGDPQGPKSTAGVRARAMKECGLAEPALLRDLKMARNALRRVIKLSSTATDLDVRQELVAADLAKEAEHLAEAAALCVDRMVWGPPGRCHP